jgi:hypothetical protein
MRMLAKSSLLSRGTQMIRNRTLLLILTLALTGAAWALADDPRQNPDTPKPSQTDPSKKPVLTDVSRVSTDQARADAAKQEAKKRGLEEKQKDSPDDAVLEFHPAAPDNSADGSAVVTKDSKKGRLKNVHGEAYGAAGGGGNREGGKVGASSKSGKTAISVGVDRSSTTPPR